MVQKLLPKNRSISTTPAQKAARKKSSSTLKSNAAATEGAWQPKGAKGVKRPTTAPVLLRCATSEGHFQKASAPHLERVANQYLASLRAGELKKAPAGDIQRFESKDLALDYNTMSAAELDALTELGVPHASELYTVSSAAGLWTRGGGQIKALTPLNLAELITRQAFDRVVHLNAIVNASSPQEALLMARRNVDVGPNVTLEQARAAEKKAGEDLIKEAKQEIESIIAPAREHARAVNPVVMHLINHALASRKAKTYIPFDLWTGESNHVAIHAYVESFKEKFHTMEFHPDAKVQATIVSALKQYFANAKREGDTHVFGFQIGLPALDPATGAPLKDSQLIGEGAGMLKAYLDESGRTAQMERRGKKILRFQNIEVFEDVLLRLGAHVKAGKDVSVSLVPQRPGYAGGNPFKVDGQLRLLEQSAVGADLASGNAYFNANTIDQPLHARPPTTLGFESKSNNTQVRAKQNAHAVTDEYPTAGIGVRIGKEYQNFKNFDENRQHGGNIIRTYQDSWARLAQ